jgi:hypothetical protein
MWRCRRSSCATAAGRSGGGALVFGNPQLRSCWWRHRDEWQTTSVWVLRHLLATRGGAASIGTLGAVLPDGSISGQ